MTYRFIFLHQTFTCYSLPVCADSRHYPAPSSPILKGERMKTSVKKLTLALGTVLLSTMFAATANAACGDYKAGASLHRQSWDLGTFQPGSLLLASDDADAIVGMWHATFTAEGNEPGPPDGTPIDNTLVVWHSDGTEIMNSARPPQDGDFCLGVWQKTGRLTYKLNHFAWLSNDTANAPSGIGNPQGPTRFFEEITLSPDGKHYTGRFTLDASDPSGNPVAHIVGVISATRVTVDTKIDDLL
jgi:hypothetical protein